MRRRARFAVIPALMAVLILLCGFSFGRIYVTLDVRDNTLYREMSAGEIFDAVSSDLQAAKQTYDRESCAVFGKLKSVAKDGRSFEITAADTDGTQNRSIHCILGENYSGSLPAVGSVFYTLGELRITALGSGSCSLEAAGIRESSSRLASDEVYLTVNGDIVRPGSMTVRTFGKNSITKDPVVSLKIPESFVTVEEKLPNLDGYLYRLNEMRDTRNTRPEQFYIFWFDNEEQLYDQNDKNRSQDIARAIIKNILPGENIRFGRFPIRRTVYGQEYMYYDTAYSGHNAEFVFKPCGTDGILCMLYVYRNSDHKKDILSIFRFVEG